MASDAFPEFGCVSYLFFQVAVFENRSRIKYNQVKLKGLRNHSGSFHAQEQNSRGCGTGRAGPYLHDVA